MKKAIILLAFSITILLANTTQDAIKAFEKKDYQKSFKLFSKLDSPEAHYYVGKHYYYGYGVNKDVAKALKYEQIACNENFAKGCKGAGWIYKHDKKDDDLALSYYKKGCKLGSGEACNEAGVVLAKKKNLKKAVHYYKKACNLNESWGCDNLAGYYKNGKGGLDKNLSIALKYYKKGCDLKNGNSCNSIGFIYDKDYNDCKNSIKYYTLAKDLNNDWGYANLSYYFISGKCVKKDLNRGLQLAKKAADLNNSFGFNNIGVVYNDKKIIKKL